MDSRSVECRDPFFDSQHLSRFDHSLVGFQHGAPHCRIAKEFRGALANQCFLGPWGLATQCIEDRQGCRVDVKHPTSAIQHEDRVGAIFHDGSQQGFPSAQLLFGALLSGDIDRDAAHKTMAAGILERDLDGMPIAQGAVRFRNCIRDLQGFAGR